MSKRLQQNVLSGPDGEVVKLNWMPDGRLRLDLINCGKCVVTKIFPNPQGLTNIEVSYGTEKPPITKPNSKVPRVLHHSREYRIIKPSKDAKPYTSPAAMACLRIIKDCCAAKGFCTEGELKPQILARASEITPVADSAWRFLQYYRPRLVNAEMITYKK